MLPIKDVQDYLAILTVGSAVLLNFALAIINANFFGVDEKTVVVVQLFVTASAVLLIFRRRPNVPSSYYFAVLALCILTLLTSIIQQKVDHRFLYNILLIPIFTLLGATTKSIDIKWLNWLVLIILCVCIIEVVIPNLYALVINPLSYYVSTRPWAARTAINWTQGIPDFGFYVGALRSGGENLLGFNQHRVGSIFMEPLSLSYFAVIASLSYVYLFNFRSQKLVLLLLACLLLSVLSDTRTATVLLLLLVFFAAFFQRTTHIIGFWIPVFIICFFWAVFGLTFNSDSHLAFRLGITFLALEEAGAVNIFFGGITSPFIGDSGLLQLIGNAGLPGAFLYFYIASGFIIHKQLSTTVSLSVLVFLVTVSMFGAAFFSIKTGAILGFLLGAFSVGSIRVR